MQRYTVTIVSPAGATNARPTLIVPFQPSALVQAFVDELWKRVARQNIPLAPNTHIATLHIDSDTGAIVDCEDVLADVIDHKEKLFAVFAQKDNEAPLVAQSSSNIPVSKDTVAIRIITPSLAKDHNTCPIIHVPAKSTIRHMHDLIAEHLNLHAKTDENPELLECNCKLAADLSDGPGSLTEFLVVHGKSAVERIDLKSPTELALKEALRARFGADIEAKKRVHLTGAVTDVRNRGNYAKTPVVHLCSKIRHLPQHGRATFDISQARYKVLDLHTSEQPINPACMGSKIEDAGLIALAHNGATDIFAVERTTAVENIQTTIGQSSIYRSRPHWEPKVVQSDRGVAMFLSSLRVFVSLVQDMKDEERAQDAVLHVVDLLTNFTPAVRAIYILSQGKTIGSAESAAISAAFFETLNGFLPTEIVGSDQSRLFEGARLLFGFIMDKARSLKLAEEVDSTMPYLGSFQTVELRDYRTNETVMEAVQTMNGLIEGELFNAFLEGGLLFNSHLQSFMIKTEMEPSKQRQALVGGGIAEEITVFSALALIQNYRYADCGYVNRAIDLDELIDLNHLAELAARNKLAVHKPGQLSSAVAPCLTFDCKAHLAVYTGEQPCGNPGRSSLVFRPMHGEETLDTAVAEQLIAPIIRTYQANGTAVLDALGGATVKRLEEPDEIIMFAVDVSSSMGNATDFVDVDHDESQHADDSPPLVETRFYNNSTLDDTKERICKYECFDDMVAIVAEAPANRRPLAALNVLETLRSMLLHEIEKKTKNIEDRRQLAPRLYHLQQYTRGLEAELNKMKSFWAGLKTHEDPISQFLVYRSSLLPTDVSRRWTWSMGDEIPTAMPAQMIPTLSEDILQVPHRIRCPISYTLMEDAVVAADGYTYSEAAIRHWFSIRLSSPMTGLNLDSIALASNVEVCDAAQRWAEGDGIPGRSGGELKRSKSSKDVVLHFDSKVGTFERAISPDMTLEDLYKLAFRGLKGKFVTFQLSSDRSGPLESSSMAKIASRNIRDGDHISVRIAEDQPSGSNPDTTSGTGYALIKVYESSNTMRFAYWVKKDDERATLTSILWKYSRQRPSSFERVSFNCARKMIWTNMHDHGDNWLEGTPHDNTTPLSSLLTRGNCSGILGHEKVYDVPSESRDSGAPLVLKVWITREDSEEQRNNRLTRLDVLKQMFEALINRIHAYNYKTHIGLVTFASECTLAKPISHVLENFRQATRDMEAKGDTKLWDALALAKHELKEYGTRYPNAKKRIITISDGQDNKSITNTKAGICWDLHRDGVALDSVCLGNDSNNPDLLTVSYALGCYRFEPTSLVNALAICEMEPLLSLSERPPIEPHKAIELPRGHFFARFFDMQYRVSPTSVSADKIPPRKEHPNLRDSFVELTNVTAKHNSNGQISGGNWRSNLRTKRLMAEMTRIANTAHPTYDVYLSESDFSFWKIVMSGPEGTAYGGGNFLMYLHADGNYPTFAPKVRLITQVQHPNVNMHGRVCHSILDRDWTSDVSMTTLLDTVYGLLLQPEHSDPVNTITTLSYHHDEVEFADEVREHVAKYAAKTREEWREEILEEGDGDLSEPDETGEESEEDDEVNLFEDEE